jgi:ribosome-binding protein aMBF1 (putative translation factor)
MSNENARTGRQPTGSPVRRLTAALANLEQEALRALAEAEAWHEDEPDTGLSLAEFVKEHRTAQGWSLQELADRAGCTKGHVWEIEAGNSRNPTVKMVHGLAVALGVPAMALFRAAVRDALPPMPQQ